jgi:alginate O-acetyltransferase complex protein AlgI
MSFDSLSYAVFLGAVLLMHRVLPWRFGRVGLLVASYFFYGVGGAWHCALLFAATAVNFAAALRMDRMESGRGRKAVLAAAISASLGMLVSFKYGAFLAVNANSLLALLGAPALPVPEVAFPAGISFYTFQTLSYTIDVYYGKERPTRDFLGFALYVSFFPQLVAGPIERFSRLMPQLREKRPVSLRDAELGFQRILWGLVKKTVIADRLALYVDAVFRAPGEASGVSLAVATFCFAIQVYLDFGAYCDIAIGSARMIGVTLSENFRWPFLARNPSELWVRWHITLSSWFRDYLFTALVGRKRPGPIRQLFNVVAVMVIAGLWHGASWHFVAYGLAAGIGIACYEAVYLVSGRSRAKPLLGRGPAAAVAAMAGMHLFGLSLIALFRCQTIHDVGLVFRGIACGPWIPDALTAAYGTAGFAIWLAVMARGWFYKEGRRDLEIAAPLRGLFWMALALAILYGAVDTHQQFVYFQF